MPGSPGPRASSFRWPRLRYAKPRLSSASSLRPTPPPGLSPRNCGAPAPTDTPPSPGFGMDPADRDPDRIDRDVFVLSRGCGIRAETSRTIRPPKSAQSRHRCALHSLRRRRGSHAAGLASPCGRRELAVLPAGVDSRRPKTTPVHHPGKQPSTNRRRSRRRELRRPAFRRCGWIDQPGT